MYIRSKPLAHFSSKRRSGEWEEKGVTDCVRLKRKWRGRPQVWGGGNWEVKGGVDLGRMGEGRGRLWGDLEEKGARGGPRGDWEENGGAGRRRREGGAHKKWGNWGDKRGLAHEGTGLITGGRAFGGLG